MPQCPTRARRIAATASVFVLTSACARGGASIGPLTMEAPPGWRVTDQADGDLKLTNGSVAGETSTKPGTATAVFDVYVPSTQTLSSFLNFLRDQKIVPTREAVVIDGYEGVLLSYAGPGVGGRQEAMFVPRRETFVVYRAAYPNDVAAFEAGRPAFRRAIRSIRFSRRPPPPTRGPSAAGRPGSYLDTVP